MIATRCSLDDVRRLAEVSSEPCVSIYLPTHRYGQDVPGDRIRLKNLVAAAERAADERGQGKEVRELLDPVRALDGRQDFWQHQSEGLAVLACAESGVSIHHLPVAVEEFVSVGDHFSIRPLLAATGEELSFHILALSQNSVRLFECDRGGAREIDLSEGPTSLEDAVGHDWEQKSLQFHTGTSAHQPGGARPAVFHGQGRPSGGEPQEELEIFLQRLDNFVVGVLGDRGAQRAPMVLAAVDNIAAAYRNTTRHPNLLEEVIQGKHEILDARELHQKAMALMQARLDKAREERMARIREALVAGEVSTSIREILEAAEHARVKTLIVRRDEPVWGVAGAAGEGVEIHPKRRPESEDLLDVAARRALMRGSEVLAADADQMPEGATVAASMRF